MADKTLTRMDLNEAVFSEVGLSRNESADLVESVLNHISAVSYTHLTLPTTPYV